MKVSILIATYGKDEWKDLAWSRAYPSTSEQDAHEVLIHHEPDATISQVRNAMAERATGDWLCFLDADDELNPGYLGAMRRYYERAVSRGIEGPMLLAPQVVYVLPSGKRKPPIHLRNRKLEDDNYIVVGTLVERDLFLKVGGFGEYPHGFEDWSLWAKCWKAGAMVNQVTGAIYIAYINPDSAHRVTWKDTSWQREMHHRVRKDIFPELYEGRRRR